MKKGPGLFSSFGNKPKESLTNDYMIDQKLSISTATVARVAARSTATNRNGVSKVDIGATYKSKNTSIRVKVDAESNITMTFGFKKIVPLAIIVASLDIHDFESGKIKVECYHHHATLTSSIYLNQAPTIGVSATIGTPTFAMGAKAYYKTSSSKFKNFEIGINYNRPNSTASLVLGDNGDNIRALYSYRFDILEKIVAAVEITRRLSSNKTNFVVGGCYVFDDRTIVKAKIDNRGKLGAVLQHKIISKSLVSLSTEVNTKALHKTPKFGLALVLKP